MSMSPERAEIILRLEQDVAQVIENMNFPDTSSPNGKRLINLGMDLQSVRQGLMPLDDNSPDSFLSKHPLLRNLFAEENLLQMEENLKKKHSFPYAATLAGLTIPLLVIIASIVAFASGIIEPVMAITGLIFGVIGGLLFGKALHSYRKATQLRAEFDNVERADRYLDFGFLGTIFSGISAAITLLSSNQITQPLIILFSLAAAFLVLPPLFNYGVKIFKGDIKDVCHMDQQNLLNQVMKNFGLEWNKKNNNYEVNAVVNVQNVNNINAQLKKIMPGSKPARVAAPAPSPSLSSSNKNLDNAASQGMQASGLQPVSSQVANGVAASLSSMLSGEQVGKTSGTRQIIPGKDEVQTDLRTPLLPAANRNR